METMLKAMGSPDEDTPAFIPLIISPTEQKGGKKKKDQQGLIIFPLVDPFCGLVRLSLEAQPHNHLPLE